MSLTASAILSEQPGYGRSVEEPGSASRRLSQVDSFDMVIFGATGDLSRRKLLPSLYLRDRDGRFPETSRIIGVSRQDLTVENFRNLTSKVLSGRVRPPDFNQESADRFLRRLQYISADVSTSRGWDILKRELGIQPSRIRVFYLATLPELFAPICRRLSEAALITRQSRVVIEKPVGFNLPSADDINDGIGRYFPESSIYRIDHYLGKETVQNLMALRFGNAMFEPLWNAGHIEHVQISVTETLGIEGRADYYDRSGALRDMVQNHLLQLLCLVAMEPPINLAADAVRNEKLKVLTALKPLAGGDVARNTVRGQYRAGIVDGVAAAAYGDEGGSSSFTETFVAIKTEICNWRWAGVPFYLRTGKRLARRCSEIAVFFRPIKHSVFDGNAGLIKPNRLVIRLQPDEGVKLWLMIKVPGPGGVRLQQVPLDMTFADAFRVRQPESYERLLMDVIRGNQTLFMRRDEVEAAWSWIDPIFDSWQQLKQTPRPYAAGTWGPPAAIALIERDGRSWNEDDCDP